ncbi:MAG: acetate kinase [Candidatus Woesearchaeota archaeon]
MEHILILNIGSSSIKYSLFKGETSVMKGYIERVKDYAEGIHQIVDIIDQKGFKIDAIGHRVVHGGTNSRSVRLDVKRIKELDKIVELAPLHDGPELKGIRTCMKLFDVPQVAIFDTAFHQTMPEKAFTYAIPKALAKKHRIRRYGFHGPSHHYISDEAAKLMGRQVGKTKIITCHLGNGCSIAAIDGGKSVDTSMGLTPLEGLVMGTRSGDLDPAIIPYLQHKEKWDFKKVDYLLNKASGLIGLCGRNDMRDIHEAMVKDHDALVAHQVFCYRIIKYMGAYIAAMGGVDAIVFTGGIGEHAWWVREEILSHFRYIGLRINKKANKENRVRISSHLSKKWVFVIPTQEELMMSREVRKVLGN